MEEFIGYSEKAWQIGLSGVVPHSVAFWGSYMIYTWLCLCFHMAVPIFYMHSQPVFYLKILFTRVPTFKTPEVIPTVIGVVCCITLDVPEDPRCRRASTLKPAGCTSGNASVISWPQASSTALFTPFHAARPRCRTALLACSSATCATLKPEDNLSPLRAAGPNCINAPSVKLQRRHPTSHNRSSQHISTRHNTPAAQLRAKDRDDHREGRWADTR